MTFVQGLSDWFTPQNYSGEFKAIPMGYRNNSDGTSSENNALYLYGYSFALNSAKTIQSVGLPNNANVVVTAISTVPNWPPTFSATTYTLASVNAGASYSGSIAANVSDLNGDILVFAKVSGPGWLNVAANGTLSGTLLSSDVGTNTFVVSVTDPGNLSDTATMNILVLAPQPIVVGLAVQPGQSLLTWTGGIGPYQVQQATNLDSPVWQNFGAPTSDNSLSVMPTNSAAFY